VGAPGRTGFGTAVTKRMVARSGGAALFISIAGIGLQMARSRLIAQSGPPRLDHVIGVSACYLVMSFAFALGFFLIERRIPGRTRVGKGLGYSALVIFSFWISGFVNMFAVDFDGLWDPLSSAKIDIYGMALVDILNLMLGGMVLGLMSRQEGRKAPVEISYTANFAARIAAAVIALPLLCAGLFWLVSGAVPSGYDLSGGRTPGFYLYLFGPCALTGAGAAIFHDALRSGGAGSIIGESLKIFLFVFIAYWATNTVFVLFFGFTWQIVADFLLAGAASLFLSIVMLEMIARAPGKTAVR